MLLLLLLLLLLLPAKRLCDASSVLLGVELPISSRFQPSPLASKLLAASRKGEHCASVSPCQYIAYPQQVLCSAFSWRQVLLGTVRPQHWICKGESVWPNGEAGGWGQEKSQWLLWWRRSYKNFSGCKCLHPDTLWQKSPGWRGGRTDMSTSRQHQQEATAARLRGQCRVSAGCRRCWMAIPDLGRGDSTTLAGHLSRRTKTSNRNQVMAGAFTRPAWGKKNPKKNWVWGHPLMSPATEGREQWPMRRVLPTKPIVHAPTTLWPCNCLWNGVVLSFWIVAGEGQRWAPSLKGDQPQLPTATLTPLVWPWMGRVWQMVNKHSRSSSGMRKESDLKRRDCNTSWNSKRSMCAAYRRPTCQALTAFS